TPVSSPCCRKVAGFRTERQRPVAPRRPSGETAFVPGRSVNGGMSNPGILVRRPCRARSRTGGTMRQALRALGRSPGFAAAVIVTLALGIGANTAVFSVLRGVLLRPLPNRDGERLVYLRQSAMGIGQQSVLFSVPEIIDMREQSTRLTGFGEFSQMTFTMLD